MSWSDPGVQPALTPQEWEGLCCLEGECRDDEIWARVRLYHPDIDERSVDELDCHALAALALHGQPFGFTREMAEAIRTCASIAANQPEPELWDLALQAADRISALLPPVEK